jgi:hypothetical protein
MIALTKSSVPAVFTNRCGMIIPHAESYRTRTRRFATQIRRDPPRPVLALAKDANVAG